jgi:putative OPT family oligopeptide transporter
MAIRPTSYRRPVTPAGLKAIETDTLDWYSPELYANFNTGVLEEYLEERNRRDSFDMCPWDWKAIWIGIVIGTVFAFITEYVGLKVGLAVAGGAYVVYAVGLALKWKPTLNNNASGAATAATSVGTGFIFTYPAVWLLAQGQDYPRILPDGSTTSWIPVVPPVSAVILAVMIAGILGTLYFILFRRIWLVDDPLPTPGFEASVQLMEIANEIHKGTPFNARRLITLIFGTTAVAGGYTFLKDGAFFGAGGEQAPFDMVASAVGAGSIYSEGTFHLPLASQHYTAPELGLSSLLVGIGWFMRFRVAMLVSLGSFLTWFVIIPIAVASHTPVYNVPDRGFVPVDTLSPSAGFAYAKIARYVAIGAILGGGLLALFKMYPVFVPAIKDVGKAVRGGPRTDYVKGKGWYEWPLSHIWFMIIFATISIPIIFMVLGGTCPTAADPNARCFSIGPAIALGLLLFALTFALGAIAVKVQGETGQEPVSGTTFLFLLVFIGVMYAIGTNPSEMALIGILGATTFGCAITMSGTIILDYKAGLYVGNRPYHLMRSTLTGIIPGAPVAAIAATIFSLLMVSTDPAKHVNFLAPQANAFAGLISTILGSPATPLLLQYLLLGVFIGIAAEYLTGMGTAFGLGMYFPLSLVTPNLLGGILRDVYEHRVLDPRAKAEKWTEKQYILKVLDTFMVASGLIIGEAVVSVLITFIYIAR